MTTINDANWAFLSEQTGMSAPYNDMYFHYLRSLGYTGTLQDMIAASGFTMNPSGLKNPINNESAFSLDAFMAAQSDGLYFDTTKLDRFYQEDVGPTLADDVDEAIGLALSQRAWNGQTLAQLIADQTDILGNGDGTSLTGWSTFFGTASIVAGRFRVTSNGSASSGRMSRPITCVVGRTYQVAFKSYTGSVVPVFAVAKSAGAYGDAVLTVSGPTAGSVRYFVATQTTHYIMCTMGSTADGSYVEFDDLVVKEIPGKHGIQATAGLKPTRQTTGAKFDGTDDYLATSYAAGVGANFIVTLADVPASIAAVQVFAGVNGGANDRFFVGVDTGGLIVGGVGAQSVTTIKGATDRRNQQIVVGLSCDGTTVRLFGDSALIYEGAQSGNPNTSLGIWLGATNISGASGNRFGGSIKKLVAGREFLDLVTYRNIRHALLVD